MARFKISKAIRSGIRASLRQQQETPPRTATPPPRGTPPRPSRPPTLKELSRAFQPRDVVAVFQAASQGRTPRQQAPQNIRATAAAGRRIAKLEGITFQQAAGRLREIAAKGTQRPQAPPPKPSVAPKKGPGGFQQAGKATRRVLREVASIPLGQVPGLRGTSISEIRRRTRRRVVKESGRFIGGFFGR